MTNQRILEIIDLNGYSKGVSKAEDGKIIFVDNSLPGDVLEVDFTEHTKRFSRAKIRHILKPSQWRTAPFCKHFNQCNGCQLQHTKLNHYLEAKQLILKSKLRGPLKSFADNKIIPSPLTHYRNKATFQWNPRSNSVSFLNEDNEEVPINECNILEYEINNWISSLTDLVDFPTRLVLKSLPEQGLVLGIHSQKAPVEIKDMHSFIAVYWLQYEKVEAYGKLKWLKSPQQALTENLGDLTIGWHPQGFFQTNRWIAKQMFLEVAQWIKQSQIKIVWDFYCGSGWILQFIKKDIELGYGFEISQNAIRIAKEVPKSKNLHFIEANLPRIPNKKYPIADCWIFNPPRKGIGKKTIDTIFNHNPLPSTIIYMSCNPDSLGTDLKMLTKYGYQVEKCKFYDMFPWTSHFEVLCLLKQSV